MVRSGGKSKGKSSRSLCAAGEKGCLNPDGTVVWVFCEACESWYHCICANVDEKKATDEDFIFICKVCKPVKEKEFNAAKSELKRQIGSIMDRHPVFSTALIARRCFPSKSTSNEYHFGRPGIPVTLRELEEKMMRDVSSVDHFKHLAQVMVDRMESSVKGEFLDEAKTVKTEVEKLIKSVTGGGDAEANSEVPASKAPVRSKRGSNKENNVQVDKVDKVDKSKNNAKVNAKADPPKPVRESKRRGAAQKRGAAATETQTAPEEPLEEPTAPEPESPVKNAEKPAEPSPPTAPKAKKGRAKKEPAKKTKEPVENAVKESKPKRNRRTTKKKQLLEDEKVPNSEEVKENDAKATVDSPPKEVGKTAAVAPPTPSPVKGGRGGSKAVSLVKDPVSETAPTKPPTNRKRKNASALSTVNSNRSAKVQKTGSGEKNPVSALPSGTTTIAAKVISGSPGSIAKIAIAGGVPVNLASLSQPLPPQVVLPTTPVSASQVRSVKNSAPPPQVIQMRPSGALATPTMQMPPLRAAAPGLNAVPRPQFFKIVGGKPVQISNLQRLPAIASLGGLPTSASGGNAPGGRVVYMRAPVPPQIANLVGSSTSTSSTGATTTTTTSAGPVAGAPPGSKIILVSNKGQAIPVNKGAMVSGAPSIVRIVSPNSLSTGGKLALSPSSPNKVTALRPASGSSGPILLRTVAPRPVTSSASAPIQLPLAPLPKSALNTAGSEDKKANDASKAIQVLLPKSPLPPTSNNTSGSPQKSPGGVALTTTTTTTASGAFVWTNSTRANFKLSSRINFASLERFKNVVNKDVHFILASIVTEDKSNEFSFRLHLKREPTSKKAKETEVKDNEAKESEAKATDEKAQDKAKEDKEGSAGAKTAATEQVSFLELEGKAKVPTAQEWSLKVKTEPPVFLVSKGNFLTDFPAVRIPKEIAEKPFVDYELHIDKCSPMQVAKATVVTSPPAATIVTSTGPPSPVKKGRKVK